MKITNRTGLAPLTAALAVTAAAGLAVAQTPPAATPAPAERQMTPPPVVEPGVKPSDPSAEGMGNGQDAAGRADAGAKADGVKSADMVGLPVFASDGNKIGDVTAIKVTPDGKLSEVHVKTGGVLGFGARTVKVPADKVTKTGQSLRLAMSGEDVGKLPEADGKKG